jgi:hypothetical protein
LAPQQSNRLSAGPARSAFDAATKRKRDKSLPILQVGAATVTQVSGMTLGIRLVIGGDGRKTPQA